MKAHLLGRAVDIFPVTAVYHEGMSLGTQLPAFGSCFLNAMLEASSERHETKLMTGT